MAGSRVSELRHRRFWFSLVSESGLVGAAARRAYVTDRIVALRCSIVCPSGRALVASMVTSTLMRLRERAARCVADPRGYGYAAPRARGCRLVVVTTVNIPVSRGVTIPPLVVEIPKSRRRRAVGPPKIGGAQRQCPDADKARRSETSHARLGCDELCCLPQRAQSLGMLYRRESWHLAGRTSPGARRESVSRRRWRRACGARRCRRSGSRSAGSSAGCRTRRRRGSAG
jgi:hypothetical protein